LQSYHFSFVSYFTKLHKMIKYFVLLLTLLSLIGSTAFAQTTDISITLLDNDSQEPLIGATILIDELEQGTVTDVDGIGRFSDIAFGNYQFEFSYIGYQKMDTTLNIDGNISHFTIGLEGANQELEEVTVRATRSTRTIKNIPTRLEFIGAEELEEKAIMNASNISMVLRESTGIQIQQTSLVNMVSKRPDEEPELDILLSQTHTLGSTGNVFYSQRKEKVGFTLYGAAHYNAPYNPDNDNFTNIPKTTSFSFNPKLFYYPNDDATLWFGVNANIDNREGGDIDAVKNGTDSNHSYIEENKSNRISTQAAYESKLKNNQSIEIKNSVSFFDRTTSIPDYTFEGNEINTFTEFNYAKKKEKTDWITGVNLYTNSFKEQNTSTPRDLSQTTVGLFVNNTTDIKENVILESGFRTDYSTDYGFFPLPRISLLWKANNKFSTRLGGGLGYKIPDLFTEEAATLNFRNVLPIDIDNIDAERSYGANLDLNYRTAITDDLFFSMNQLFYLTEISNAILLESTNTNEFSFSNAPENIQSLGLETNVKLSFKDFRWFINYAFINTRLKYLPGNPQKPLTFRNTLNGEVLTSILKTSQTEDKIDFHRKF